MEEANEIRDLSALDVFFVLRLEVAPCDRKHTRTSGGGGVWREIVCFALYAFRRGNRRQVEIIAGRSCERAESLSLSLPFGENEKKDGKEGRKGGGKAGEEAVK